MQCRHRWAAGWKVHILVCEAKAGHAPCQIRKLVHAVEMCVRVRVWDVELRLLNLLSISGAPVRAWL